MLTKTDLQQIRGVVQEEISPLKKSLTKIEKKLDKTIDYFDNAHLSLKKRVIRVETHLGITPMI